MAKFGLRTYAAVCASLLGLGILSHSLYASDAYGYKRWKNAKAPTNPAAVPLEVEYDEDVLLHQTAQPRFRDNLRKDLKYITAWSSSGFTNDFYSLVSLLYLAQLTGRIPILPDFAAGHPVVYGGADPLPVEDVIDLGRLSEALGIPVLLWSEVKDLTVPKEQMPQEPLGCWSLHASLHNLGGVKRSPSESKMGLDVSYWPILDDARIGHVDPSAPMANLMALAALGTPDYRHRTMSRRASEPSKAPHSGETYEPSDHLQCFDYLFFTGTYSQDRLEYYEDYSPAWSAVGVHMHFNPNLVEISRKMLHRALSVPENAQTPPFIAVHVRRGDFASWCGAGMSRNDCFAPLSDYASKADEVRAALAARGVSVDPNHVLVGSDESDAQWWADVAARGWHTIDHEREETARRYGKWYPAVVDQVVQSLATGFVGTDRSTYSLVSRKRIEAWAPVHEDRIVLWGHPHSNEKRYMYTD